MLIIHICGPSGSGKTTLGSVLQYEFDKLITVKDLDELFEAYDREKEGDFNADDYQKYIYKFIDDNDKKPIVFVGLNINLYSWASKKTFDVQSWFDYFITSEDETILVQKCVRYINDKLCNLSDKALKKLVENNREFIKSRQKALKFHCDKENMVKLNAFWRKQYEKQGYTFMDQESILDEVIEILYMYLNK